MSMLLIIDKWTPLHWAARDNSNADVVKVLIEKGADVNALDNYKWTPLQLAANSNIENGADAAR